ncbi:hypothetical protein H4R33_002425 [Dimargaris cristalligena]|nr:hypothetical protein H4R33_002425 [Dimargaris cristalligena]
MSDPTSSPSTASPPITINIRPVAGPPFPVEVNPRTTTVAQLKEQCRSHSPLTPAQMRLVYSGRVLVDDHSLASYGVQSGDTIRLIRLATNGAPWGPATPAGQPRLPGQQRSLSAAAKQPQDGLSGLFNNKHLQSLLGNSEMRHFLTSANPELKKVMDSNPELASMMEDPNFIQQTALVAGNPALMREMLRNNDRALANLEMTPGGYKHLLNIYRTYQEPIDSANHRNLPSTDELNERFARALKVTMPRKTKLNISPLPNPWAPRRQHQHHHRLGLPFPPATGPSRPLRQPTGSSDDPLLGPVPSFFNSALLGRRNQPPSTSGQPSHPTDPSAPPPTTPRDSNISNLLSEFSALESLLGLRAPSDQSDTAAQGSSQPPAPNAHPGPPPPATAAPGRTLSPPAFPSPILRPLNPGFMPAYPPGSPPDSLPYQAERSAPPEQPPVAVGAPPSRLNMNQPHLEQRFAGQLETLHGMGFTDRSLNIRALLAAGGDVHSAIEWLIREHSL